MLVDRSWRRWVEEMAEELGYMNQMGGLIIRVDRLIGEADELIFSVLMCIQVYTTEAGVPANMDAW